MVPPRTQRDNPDTLNEVQVCGAVNLIRFKTGYFLVVRKQDGAGLKAQNKARWARQTKPVSETARKEDGKQEPI
jgi:hypothetical protein